MIVLDLDGTLTNKDKVITPRTKEALMKAQEAGKIVVLASGRPTPGVKPLADELELARFGSYILSYNGGSITNCKTETEVFTARIPVEYNRRIIELAREHRVDILTYEGNDIIATSCASAYSRHEARATGMNLKLVEDLESYVDFSVAKYVMFDDDDYLVTVEPRVKAALGRRFSVYRSEPFFLEVLPHGIDKAQSIARLAEQINISKEEIIACGDGYNDLSMVKYAGLGVAMENAVLPLRNAADYITGSNNEDGVAQVVEKFML